jgi:hypothetical protein
VPSLPNEIIASRSKQTPQATATASSSFLNPREATSSSGQAMLGLRVAHCYYPTKFIGETGQPYATRQRPSMKFPQYDYFLTTAIVDGRQMSFPTAAEKFEALSRSWEDYHLGRSVIDYHDFAFEQIVGMGPCAVPHLLYKIADGKSEWIYALKCITGFEAEAPEMEGNDEAVLQAWNDWGNWYEQRLRQALQDEAVHQAVLPKSQS